MFHRLFLFSILAATCASAEPSVALLPDMAFPADDSALPGEGQLRRSLVPYVKRWQEKRSQWAGEVAQDQCAVVFFGDSITQAWGPDFKGLFPGMKLANRGLAGDTTRGILLRVDDVLALNPAAIVMLFGTNDVADGIEPEAVGRNLQRILSAIRTRHSQVPLVLCRIMPSSTEKNRPAERIRRVNAIYDSISQGDTRITVLDTWTLFADPATGDADPMWFLDMIHLNPSGYKRWADALRPEFTKLGVLKPHAASTGPASNK